MENIMNKCCGNCKFWLKLKSTKGLCDKYDLGWANSDNGARCKGWKRIRDDKPRKKAKVNQKDSKTQDDLRR